MKVLGRVGSSLPLATTPSMQGERKWCSLAKDPAPPLPPPRLLRAARDIDSCVLNPSALPFSKVHLEKRIYAAGVTCHLQGREGDSGSGKDWELPGLPGAVLQTHVRPP